MEGKVVHEEHFRRWTNLFGLFLVVERGVEQWQQ